MADIGSTGEARMAPLTEEERAQAAKVGMRLALWARVQPDVLAVQSQAGDRTFGELNASSNQLARALRVSLPNAGDQWALPL